MDKSNILLIGPTGSGKTLLAWARDTGPDGLRSIVEEVMFDIQFELPDIEPKAKYTVTAEVVRGEKPLFEKTAITDKKSA